jgi:hypothetical protein
MFARSRFIRSRESAVNLRLSFSCTALCFAGCRNRFPCRVSANSICILFLSRGYTSGLFFGTSSIFSCVHFLDLFVL